MRPDVPVACDDFQRDAADLALGHVPEPRRTDLVRHAAQCMVCDRSLTDLVAVTDRLLELAPEVEPPAGFETAAVSRMSPTTRGAAPRRRLAILAGAGVVVLVAVTVLWALVAPWPSGDDPATRSAAIVSRSGDRVGTVEVDGAASPRLIVTMEGPSDWSGVWTCEVLAAGEWVQLGSWTAEEVVNGVWAAGLPPSMTEVTAMRILGDSGAVIARAELGPAPGH